MSAYEDESKAVDVVLDGLRNGWSVTWTVWQIRGRGIRRGRQWVMDVRQELYALARNGATTPPGKIANAA